MLRESGRASVVGWVGADCDDVGEGSQYGLSGGSSVGCLQRRMKAGRSARRMLEMVVGSDVEKMGGRSKRERQSGSEEMVQVATSGSRSEVE